MKLQVAKDVDARQWDDLVAKMNGTICHSSHWAAYMVARQPNASPRYIRLISDAGQEVGALLAFELKSPHWWLAPFTRQLFTDSIPAIAEGAQGADHALAREIAAFAAREGMVEVTLGCFAPTSKAEAYRELAFAETRYCEFLLDLGPSEEDLWNGLEYKRRKNIRKAERLGVTVEELKGEEGIAELRRLQGDSSQRIVARGGPDITYKGGRARDPVNVLLERGVGRLVAARVDGQLVSAGFFTCFNGMVYHTLSGHGPEALKTQAPTFLLWETIKRFKAEGVRSLNFGGARFEAAEEGHPEHGVYVYKTAWGGRQVECSAFSKVLRPRAQKAVEALRRLARGRRRPDTTLKETAQRAAAVSAAETPETPEKHPPGEGKMPSQRAGETTATHLQGKPAEPPAPQSAPQTRQRNAED